ncbi:cell envelope integrity protein TolA [Teredinibacter haidensis]|mgnify:CR=1 FL=1|uniref:cell envelope integrity protein TolA n=1 Tax=Teredinibacter haidensis TaxID=2731755 RepID=UPI000948A065|nr:cell envelope integrity protein TolA [Teredinibacter haidensis]
MTLIRFYLIPITVSLLLHGAVIAALLYGWERAPEAKRIAPPKYIEAKLVELKPKTKKKASAKKKPKVVDVVAKRKQQERKKLLAEQKRQNDIKKKEQEEAARKAAERKKRELALAKQQDQDQKLAEQQRREQLQQEFERALEEEEGLLQEDEFATEAAGYADVIRRRIEQKWSRPPSARNGMRCELTIDMVPNGRIVDVNIKTSSGNLAFDRSAVAAVKKVENFPEIKDIPIAVFERHFRKFSLGFQPEDLRQ